MATLAFFEWCINVGFLGRRSLRNHSLLNVNEDFESERNVAFKRGQRVLAHFAERSNEKELNAEITLLGNSL